MDRGKIHADPVDKVIILNPSMKQSTQEKMRPCLDDQRYLSMPDITVTMEGLEKLLEMINPSKACGPDTIPARTQRGMAEEISPTL